MNLKTSNLTNVSNKAARSAFENMLFLKRKTGCFFNLENSIYFLFIKRNLRLAKTNITLVKYQQPNNSNFSVPCISRRIYDLLN